MLLGIGVVLALVAAAAGYLVVTSRRDDGPDHPDAWDPRVEDIAGWVQSARELRYDHPVYVDFLTPAQYRAKATGDEGGEDEGPTKADKAEADKQVAEMRALGIVEGKLDLFEMSDTLSDTGTLAYYDPEAERVYVRGTKLTPQLRVTLAHELTHALQDQHFDLDRVHELDDTQSSALRAVVEGDAERIENRYIDEELTRQERKDYDKESRASSEEGRGEVESKVPAAVVATFDAPYLFGSRFVDLVEDQKGSAAVDAAIADPPRSMEQFFDPFTYLDGDDPVKVPTPALPKGAKAIEDGTFGSIDWFIILAERIDPRLALKAVEGWGGDSWRAYEQKGKVCVEMRITGDTPADDRETASALEAWAATMPAGVASTGTTDAYEWLKSCDPGPEAKTGTTGRASDALAYPVTRTDIISGSLDEAGQERATCFADEVVGSLSLEQLLDEDGAFAKSPEFAALIAKARAACS